MYTRRKQRLTTSNLWWIFDGRLSVSFWLLFFCYVCYYAYFLSSVDFYSDGVSGCGCVLQNDRKIKKRDRIGEYEREITTHAS